MKLSDIAKRVGAGLVRDLVPGGSLLLDAVNAMLPADKKLGPNATGGDLQNLPPEVLAKKFDVEIESIKQAGETVRAMLEAEARSTHTTRPRIAMRAFYLVSVISLIIVFAWAWAVVTGDTEVVGLVVDGWPFVLAILAPFVGWLNHYFGVLRSEHANRLDAVAGSKRASFVAGVVDAIRGR